MELRQLAALTAVAETGSFSAAARRLHTVQSNVSTHVARLERELGVTLVDRRTGTLTDEGAVVVERARRIRHEVEALQADIASMRDEVSGTVRLGCIGTVSRWLVPRLLRLLAERHPKVHLVTVDATTTSLVPQVVSEDLDLAVINLPLAHTDLATEPLFDEDRSSSLRTTPARRPHRSHLAGARPLPSCWSPLGNRARDQLDEEAARGVELRCSPRSTASACSPRSPSRASVRPGHRHRRTPLGRGRLRPGHGRGPDAPIGRPGRAARRPALDPGPRGAARGPGAGGGRRHRRDPPDARRSGVTERRTTAVA